MIIQQDNYIPFFRNVNTQFEFLFTSEHILLQKAEVVSA